MWQIPKMWEGGECWIIGGGPSIIQELNIPKDVVKAVHSGEESLSAFSPYFTPIHDKHVIGVNAAFLLGDWIDVLFFGDGGYYYKNRDKIIQFPNLRVSCNPNLAKKPKGPIYGVKMVPRDGKKRWGLTQRRGHVSWNESSGGAAISFAVQMGAKRIRLLGFDMAAQGDSQHFHREYPRAQYGLPKGWEKTVARHRSPYQLMARDAQRLGVEIINVSQHSTIKAFKCAKIQDMLKEVPSGGNS